MTLTTDALPALDGFRHEALLYEDEASFVKATVRFVEGGFKNDEAILVVVSERKIDLLKSALEGNASAVTFSNMDDIGLNPARIIPAWRDFVDRNSQDGRGVRGIGEPIWPARNDAELAECHNHEALLNVAFRTAENFRLLCPYDIANLSPEVIERMSYTHPFLTNGDKANESPVYDYQRALSQAFLDPLPAPPTDTIELSFSGNSLGQLRRSVAARATGAGLSQERIDDLVLAVNEIATNSIRHGGGSGRFRLWEDDREIVCDIVDNGHIRHLLAGREVPRRDQDRGRGLWLANHVCDLVQIRSSEQGTIVRLRQAKALEGSRV